MVEVFLSYKKQYFKFQWIFLSISLTENSELKAPMPEVTSNPIAFLKSNEGEEFL